MKKKIFVMVTAIVMALVCAFGLIACGGGDDKVEGTYYAYVNGVKHDEFKVTFKDGEFTYTYTSDNKTETTVGKYTVNGNIVKITTTDGPKSETEEATYISDGVLKVDDDFYYCKDGKTPPTETEEK